MKQMTFVGAECAAKRKQTRKELFLIEPHYSTGEGGHPGYPLMAMLHMHLGRRLYIQITFKRFQF
ncbi:hypothetical protein ABH908_002747 [Pseudomonas frederiksbergensis]|jgi:IS5 family transposase|nr:IS5 family transposase [Pseudomonas sp. URMO17WK12:I6]CAH0243180.1 hypothetical protein SRABI130_03047 [Pseudomonas sp. Bi130]